MKKRGIGYGSIFFPLGLGLGRYDISMASAQLNEDGTVTILTGVADIGQGSSEIFAMIAAEELGLRPEDFTVVSADTAATPYAGPTTASRATMVTGNAVKSAASDLKQSLWGGAAELLETAPENIVIRNRVVYQKGSKTNLTVPELANYCYRKGKKYIGVGMMDATTTPLDPETGQGGGFFSFTYGTQAAEVEVDTETGEVTVLRIVAAHDVGRAINPTSVEGQIEGGVAMGLGQTMMEEVLLDRGKPLTRSLYEYLIPTIKDVPPIASLIVEEEEPKGPFGAKGVAEPPTVGVAPAIINAIYNAVGIRLTELPVRPEKVLQLLKAKGK
jgi:nicotinate dehydrogenase medium molybdopterin subunit